MALIQRLVPTSKYDIKCPYFMNPIGHCIHNTANSAPAINEATYMTNNDNEVSFHVAVDDKESLQLIPFDRNAWAAGDGGKGNGNRNYIHWEICYSKNGGTQFTEAEKRAAKEIAADMKRRGWGMDRIKKHQDFSGKYCPHRTLDTGWVRFLELIKAELNGSTSTPAPTPTPPPTITGAMYRVVAGSYTERANANAMVEKLKGDGISAFLLAVVAADGKNYLRVIAGSYSVRANADKALADLIAKGYNAFIAIYNSDDKPVTSNPTPTPPPAPTMQVGSKVNITASKYSTGQNIPGEQKGSKVHTIQQMDSTKALLKEIFSWVDLSGLKLVGTSIGTPPASGKKYVNLHPVRETWNVYRTNVAPVSGNQCGALQPKRFGGISYEVMGNPQLNVYTISTGAYGTVNIYCTEDEEDKEGYVSTTKLY